MPNASSSGGGCCKIRIRRPLARSKDLHPCKARYRVYDLPFPDDEFWVLGEGVVEGFPEGGVEEFGWAVCFIVDYSWVGGSLFSFFGVEWELEESGDACHAG